jgi:hypothetical protein
VKVKLQIIESLSKNSDVIETDTLLNVVDVAANVTASFKDASETEMADEMTNILKTSDNLGKSLDLGSEKMNKTAYAENKKKLDAMVRKNLNSLTSMMKTKKVAKIESKTPEKTLVVQKADPVQTKPMVFSISDPDDDDSEVDTSGAGGAGTVKKAKPKMAIDLTPKDLLGGIETQEGEECFIETVQSKVNPHEFSQSSDPTASASRGNLGSKILQMNVNKVSTTGSVESQTIKDIPNPIQMKIPYQPTTNSDDGSVTFKPSCKYWDTFTNTWSDKGLVFVGIT